MYNLEPDIHTIHNPELHRYIYYKTISQSLGIYNTKTIFFLICILQFCFGKVISSIKDVHFMQKKKCLDPN